MDALNKKEKSILFFISFFYFILTYYICFILYENGVFFQLNLIFDTDPQTNLNSLAHGMHEGRNAFSHAFLELLSIPIYAVQSVISIIYTDVNARDLRERLAIGYSPFFGSITLIYFYKILKLLDISQAKAVLLTLIIAFSFSTFVFSTVVETFVISGFLITATIYYYVKSENVKVSFKTWFTLGLMLTGITITNICLFFIVYFSYRIKIESDSFRAFRDSVLITFLIIYSVILYYIAIQYYIWPETSLSHEGQANWISRYLITSINHAASNFANVFSAIFNSFFGILYNIEIVDSCKEHYCSYYSFSRSSKDSIFLIFIFSLIIYFICKSYKYFSTLNQMWLFLPLGSIIGYNVIFHSFFGKEMFLYSQHWIVAAALLLLLPLKRSSFVLACILIAEIFLAGLFLYDIHQRYNLSLPNLT